MSRVSSSSARGGVPPYLGPFFAVQAAMDQLRGGYCRRTARFASEPQSSWRRLHQRHQPFRACWPTRRSRRAKPYTQGPNSDFEEKDPARPGRTGAGRCRCGFCRRRHRRSGRRRRGRTPSRIHDRPVAGWSRDRGGVCFLPLRTRLRVATGTRLSLRPLISRRRTCTTRRLAPRDRGVTSCRHLFSEPSLTPSTAPDDRSCRCRSSAVHR